MKIEKIMFVTKFEQLGFDALLSLLSLRGAALSHVVLMNVIERDRVAMRRGAGYRKSEERRLREVANIRFIDWAENLFEQGMEVGVYIVVGSMVPEVIKASAKEQADLIVIGRPHQGILEQLYAGSDVSELLQRSSTPVLVYKQLTENAIAFERPFERPLLAVDWSPASLLAVDYLKEMKDVCQLVHVVHVVGEKELKGTNALDIQKTRKETRKKLNKICSEFESAGVQAEPHVYVGETALEIEKAARECQATMVVLGSSAKASWVERWMGSTPREIAEKTVYPTLLIPPPTK